MNKKILILFTTVFFILFTNLFLIKSSAYKKIHNNYLFFDDIDNVSFTVKQHCISPKQPYATPDGNQAGSIKQGEKVGINIRAGRHGSKKTVNCTITNLLGKNKSFKDNFTFNPGPFLAKINLIKLNFAVKGTLVINGKYFDDIILAQGRAGARNNWWFGGDQCSKHIVENRPGKEALNCISRDKKTWCFLRGRIKGIKRNSPNHVKVEPCACHFYKPPKPPHPH